MASATAAATGHARGTAVHAQRKIADTKSSAVPTALTLRQTCGSSSGATPATAEGRRK
jgi:hypothetical protein